ARLSRREAARYRRLELGFVRQQLDMLEGASALDNAILKLLDARVGWRQARRQVAPLLDSLGLGARLHQRAEDLSIGERQRVLIARALSTRPRLVLADEPTGSLDSERSREVLTLLTTLCREHGVAMLLVTHDPQAAAYATRVHTLRDGRLHDEAPGLGASGAAAEGAAALGAGPGPAPGLGASGAAAEGAASLGAGPGPAGAATAAGPA
ncbi:MAG TPA: ATP-binding cassette domain-containing protein, partial [Conexibacter sp.]